jgi:2-oxoisovalerate dehydrogenase E1 component alpha subunit
VSSRENCAVSASLLRDLYARMLFTRVVDEYAGQLQRRGLIGYVASCRGHEAVQVGSSLCIEVGEDFTLPYYRDLGVVLTIGMSAYEVFRTYLQSGSRQQAESAGDNLSHSQARSERYRALPHWGYHKHNIVTGPAPVAMQILHAAGIAFTCKLRKASAVTIAYCGDGATAEADFLEGITFAAQHQLPAIFICEQDCPHTDTHNSLPSSCLHNLSLPPGLKHIALDGSNVATVYTTMQAAMQSVRDGHGPILLEMRLTRPGANRQPADEISSEANDSDPLICCQHLLEDAGAWDELWATQLYQRTVQEVEQAMQDALRDCTESL